MKKVVPYLTYLGLRPGEKLFEEKLMAEHIFRHMEDPFQEEFQKEIEGCKFQITPPELPEAKQCVFGVKDSAFYYDDIWLK